MIPAFLLSFLNSIGTLCLVEVVVDFLAISAQPIFHQNKIAMLGKVIICLLVIFAIYASANPNPSGESPSPTMMDPPAPMPRAYENAQENVRQEKCLHALSLQVARLQEELNAHQESIIYSSPFESPKRKDLKAISLHSAPEPLTVPVPQKEQLNDNTEPDGMLFW